MASVKLHHILLVCIIFSAGISPQHKLLVSVVGFRGSLEPPVAGLGGWMYPPGMGGTGGGLMNPGTGTGGGLINPPGMGTGGGLMNPGTGTGGGLMNPGTGMGTGGGVMNPGMGTGGVLNPGMGAGGGVMNPGMGMGGIPSGGISGCQMTTRFRFFPKFCCEGFGMSQCTYKKSSCEGKCGGTGACDKKCSPPGGSAGTSHLH